MATDAQTPDQRGDQDDAALGLDALAILDTAARHAASSPGTDAVVAYLDLEERVVFDLVDRLVPEGPELTAVARRRHHDIVEARQRDDTTAAADLLDAHIETERSSVYPALLDALDETGREDLAAALEEARLSRRESDQPLPRPDERASPGAALLDPSLEAPEPGEPG